MDEIDAEEKAKKSIVANECEFTVSDSVKVTWKFHQVESVCLIEDNIIRYSGYADAVARCVTTLR